MNPAFEGQGKIVGIPCFCLTNQIEFQISNALYQGEKVKLGVLSAFGDDSFLFRMTVSQLRLMISSPAWSTRSKN